MNTRDYFQQLIFIYCITDGYFSFPPHKFTKTPKVKKQGKV